MGQDFPAPLSLYLHSHDIVVHVVTVSDGKVAFAHLRHAHVLVEAEGRVVAVHVELHAAGSGMYFLDVLDGLTEKEASAVCFLEVGQHINLLEVEEVFAFGLDGYVARYFALFVGQQVDVAFFFHLLADVFGGIHPVHHVVNLCWGQDIFVGFRENLPGQLVDELAVGSICFSNGKHCVFVF